MAAPRVAIAPGPAPDWLRHAVEQGGGEVAGGVEEADALVWTSPLDVEGLAATLTTADPGLRWVQLPYAGVEDFVAAGVVDDRRQWTCGKGVYAEPVAEHALALGLAGLRDLPERVRATAWGRSSGRSLYEGRVTILGGGGIARALLGLLAPFRVDATVVRRHAGAGAAAGKEGRGAGAAAGPGAGLPPGAGAAAGPGTGAPPGITAGSVRTVGPDRLHEALRGADLVVVALALTAETRGIVGAAELAVMERHAWLVNVARGGHVVTDDLVTALAEGWIGGAALDVTDPEPLPEGHPLWRLPNCIVTPHTANTEEMARRPLSQRVTENVRRFAAGEELIGPVDVRLGY